MPSDAELALRNTTRKRIKITEVNASRQYIEGVDPTNQPIRLAWISHGPVIQVPVVGEFWVVRHHNNNWYLDHRYEDPDQVWPAESLAAGDVRIESRGRLILHSDYGIVMQGRAFLNPRTIWNEIPSGVMNSTNTTFTTANAFIYNTLRIYHNGLRILPASFDPTGSFVLTNPPEPSDSLIVDYDAYDVFDTGEGG